MTPFAQLSIVLIAVASFSLILAKLKQPLIVGFILAGVVLSALKLPILSQAHTMELLSQLGVAMLLFIIGLHLSPQSLKELGSRVVLIGIIQVVLTTLFGAICMFLFDFSVFQSVLLGLSLSFSSTIVVLKVLTDQKEEHSLFGRITTGVLLVQDIIVCTLLIVVTSISTASDGLPIQLVLIGIKSVLLFTFLYVCAKFVLPKVYFIAANHQELLFIVSLAWGCGIAALFVLAGLSLEIGALAAGVTLSNSEYAPEVSSRLKPLRDFFLLLFFVLLGSTLHISEISQLLVPIALVTLFILIVKPLITISVMRRLGFHRQTSFKTAVAIAQVSEFSFILLAAWSASYLVPSNGVTIVTIAGILSIAVSTLLLPQLDTVYNFCKPLIARIPEGPVKNTRYKKEPEAFIFGYSQVGHMFSDSLKKLGLSVLVIDFDPNQIDILVKKRIPHKFGDASDIEFLKTLPTQSVKIIISTIPQVETNLVLLAYLKQLNPDLLSILFTATAEQESSLYAAGATYVVFPHFHAANQVTSMLARFGLNRRRYEQKAIAAQQ